MIRSTTMYAFLLLCVLATHTFTHSFILPGCQISQLQSSLSEHGDPVGTISSFDSYELASGGDCKPPKQSFIDYSTFLAPNYLALVYSPSVSALLPHEPFQAPAQVYLEIDVPPDHV